jgi:hypothetical protein
VGWNRSLELDNPPGIAFKLEDEVSLIVLAARCWRQTSYGHIAVGAAGVIEPEFEPEMDTGPIALDFDGPVLDIDIEIGDSPEIAPREAEEFVAVLSIEAPVLGGEGLRDAFEGFVFGGPDGLEDGSFDAFFLRYGASGEPEDEAAQDRQYKGEEGDASAARQAVPEIQWRVHDGSRCQVSESSQMVTGPELTSSMFIMAPNSPVATGPS